MLLQQLPLQPQALFNRGIAAKLALQTETKLPLEKKFNIDELNLLITVRNGLKENSRIVREMVRKKKEQNQVTEFSFQKGRRHCKGLGKIKCNE